MRLKRLEVAGFKSFLEKTTLDFSVPLTGIVGPNGCGKSNVVDAIKWVTGELSFKELRGRSMEDLIFTGSDLRPPTGMAEVGLTLDNSDGSGPAQYKEYADISVLRRIFRDGTSEFFINKIPCRLRDIVDIFLDTGVGQSSYSIIEQGRVEMIVSSKPEDRREIIEEAAGITKYKHRKKAAVRKMEFTKQNLLRVTDIIGELKRQINSLERQARKAERFREYRDRARKLDVALSARSHTEIRRVLAENRKKEQDVADRFNAEQTEVLAYEAGIERRRLSLAQKETELEKQQHDRFGQATAIQQLEARIEGQNTEASQLRAMALDEKERSESLVNRRVEMEGEVSRISTLLTDLERESAEVQNELEETETQQRSLEDGARGLEMRISGYENQMLESVARVAEQKNQAVTREERTVELDRQLAVRLRELERANGELMQLEQAYAERQRAIGTVQQLRFNFEQEQGSLRKRMESMVARRTELETALAELDRTIEGQRSRLATLESFVRTYQAYGSGARAVMEWKEDAISGLLGELIHPQRGYERAVEAALSTRVECLVVDGHENALSMIERLKREGRGRGAFLPRTALRSSEGKAPPQGDGVIGWLKDYVHAEDSCRSAFDVLLGDVVLVQSLFQGLAIWNRGTALTFVTPDGDVVTREGVVIGGTWGEERGVLQLRREMEELRESLESSRASREKVEREFLRLRSDIQTANRELERVSQSLEQESRNVVTHEKDVERLEEARRRSRQSVEVIEEEIHKIRDEKGVIEGTSVTATLKMSEMDRAQAELKASLLEANQALSEARIRLNTHVELQTAARVRQAAIKERLEAHTREHHSLLKQIELSQSEAAALKQSSLEHDRRAVELRESSRQLSDERGQAVSVHQLLDEKIQGLRTAHDEELEQVREQEAKLKQSREQLTALHEGLSGIRMAAQEETLRLEHLESQVKERHGIVLREIVESEGYTPINEADIEASTSELAELRDKMAKMGDVNIAAIQEVDELQKRHEFLTLQKDDLEKTLGSLSSAIRKINSTTRQLFIDTFEAVDKKFQEVFPRLFRGGKARLVLLDPENILETGVDIVARPPGKRLQNMNLLSGGEKALTAIALLFAIFQHKAPPFCLLDEVDAPLDDANVRRYSDLVKEMGQTTQFILITHNKVSMEIVQNLYGITMEEPGVSRCVSVRIQPAQAVVAQPQTLVSSSAVA
ncbi:MAG TPA: chromosome segregation protein SMC [Bdellovibrionota bacterium]|nr:chromosome segregation protein SMC [Bdellovibrionota bacterium]